MNRPAFSRSSSDTDRRGKYRAVLVATLVGAACLALLAWSLAAYRVHEILTERHLQNAAFGPPPRLPGAVDTAREMLHRLRAHDGPSLVEPLIPSQSGVLWLFAVLVCLVGLDASGKTRTRRIDIIALLVLGVLLYDITAYLWHLSDGISYRVMDWTFLAIAAVSVLLAIRSLRWSRVEGLQAWQPPVPLPHVRAAALVLIGLTALVALGRDPDDAGFYTNLGAQRLREQHWFPYGDPVLSGSAAAGYGPVLFLAHLPFQVLLDPHTPNPHSPVLLGPAHDPPYFLPPMQATQLTTLAFHLVGVIALWFVARRLAGAHVAWSLLVLYCGSPFVLGVGGRHESVGGVTFISHMAPTALALLALLWIDRPLLAGFALASSVATVFAPLFFIPSWIGYYQARPGAVVRFVGGMCLAGLLIGGPVLLRSHALQGRGVLATVVHDTVGHHQGADTYGQSPFGLWGGRGGVRAILRTELLPGVSVSSPMFMAASVFMLSGLWLGRGRTPRQLAALMAAMGIASQLWKIHGTGVYVNWYYPFFLIGAFTSDAVHRSRDPRHHTGPSA